MTNRAIEAGMAALEMQTARDELADALLVSIAYAKRQGGMRFVPPSTDPKIAAERIAKAAERRARRNAKRAALMKR